MDGNSIDGTCVEAQKFIDKRIHIFSSIDLGVYDAMNFGIKISKGNWLYFMGSDDWFFNESVLSYISYRLTITRFNVAYGNVLIHGDSNWAKDKEIYAGKFNMNKLLRKNICHQSLFYRNSFLKSNELKYDLSFPINSDWDFNIKCLKITKFLYLDIIVANFSSGGLSSSSCSEDKFDKKLLKYLSEHKPSKLFLVALRIKKILFNKL